MKETATLMILGLGLMIVANIYGHFENYKSIHEAASNVVLIGGGTMFAYGAGRFSCQKKSK